MKQAKSTNVTQPQTGTSYFNNEYSAQKTILFRLGGIQRSDLAFSYILAILFKQ